MIYRLFKNKKFLGAILAVLLITSFGCTKLKLPALTCNIDGTEYQSALVVANHGEVFEGQNGFLILASDEFDLSEGHYLGILVRGEEVGKYDLQLQLDNGKAQCGVIYKPNGENDTNDVYLGTSGYVEITEVDSENNRISGKFEFELVNGDNKTIKITDGEFKNVIYTNVTLSDLDSFDN